MIKINSKIIKIIKKSAFLFAIYAFLIITLDNINISKNPLFNDILKKFVEDNFFNKENNECNKLDPIYLMGQRFKKPSINLCKNQNSEHICFQSSKYDEYNQFYWFPNGIICSMKNFTLDPSKSSQTHLLYKGPIDKINKGHPILSKGFFSTKCECKNNYKRYSKLYTIYFNSWNYYNKETTEELEELAPGKTIFFISRNQDSPNLFHGISEIINALSIIYLFNIDPKKIQIIFLESMIFQDEPLYDLYTNLISLGNNPIYIRDIKKKYHISNAFHIPVSGDSPLFLKINSPNCIYSTKTYEIFNDLINKYLSIPKFKDTYISDNETFYYPNQIIKSNNVKKKITIQWRKIWPKGRTKQKRILGNGPELADKLALIIPDNFLIRLVDTASLPIIQQISLMKDTDYLIGIHGAGLALSIFMPKNSILHEISPYKMNQLLLLMSNLSGHKSYSNIIESRIKYINDNEYIYFNEDSFSKIILKRVNEIICS